VTRWQAGKLLQGKHRGFFIGPYQLLRHLAKGGMSTLYVAAHTRTGDICALKVLPPAKAEQTDASYLQRFLREAKLTCKLRHPNIIRVDEFLTNQEFSTLIRRD
jgi:serine/threonine protein kinase